MPYAPNRGRSAETLGRVAVAGGTITSGSSLSGPDARPVNSRVLPCQSVENKGASESTGQRKQKRKMSN